MKTGHTTPFETGFDTGFTDCCGNPIFLGDTIKEGCNGLTSKVVYNKKRGAFWLDRLRDGYGIENAGIEWTVINSVKNIPLKSEIESTNQYDLDL